MPGYDRTGPMGAGPRTGGGFGFCRSGRGGRFVPDSAADWTYGRGRGRGFFGLGRRRFWSRPWVRPYAGEPLYPQDETSALKARASELQNELQALKNRLAEIESRPDDITPSE